MRKTIEALLIKHGWTFEKLKEFEGIKLELKGYEPLCIEYVGKDEFGYDQYSIAHYHMINGDAVCDPEVVFTEIPCVDKRKKSGLTMKWYPRFFENIFGFHTICKFSDKGPFITANDRKNYVTYINKWEENIKNSFLAFDSRIAEEVY